MGLEQLFARCEHGVDVESTVQADLSRRRANSPEGEIDVQQIFECEADILVEPVRSCCMRATGALNRLILGGRSWGASGEEFCVVRSVVLLGLPPVNPVLSWSDVTSRERGRLASYSHVVSTFLAQRSERVCSHQRCSRCPVRDPLCS